MWRDEEGGYASEREREREREREESLGGVGGTRERESERDEEGGYGEDGVGVAGSGQSIAARHYLETPPLRPISLRCRPRGRVL